MIALLTAYRNDHPDSEQRRMAVDILADYDYPDLIWLLGCFVGCLAATIELAAEHVAVSPEEFIQMLALEMAENPYD